MKKTHKSHHDDHHQEPRSGSSCAACRLLKRRCGPNCIFAPYFRADEPKKFAKVHRVFGASNVSKLLNEVPEEHREDTVNSLTYEAEARLRDPVYGCLGPISYLYGRMAQLQHDLALARARLARYAAEVEAPAEGGGGYDGGCGGGGGYNNGGGAVAGGDHENIHECLPMVWNGLQSDGGDFGQVPIFPL